MSTRVKRKRARKARTVTPSKKVLAEMGVDEFIDRGLSSCSELESESSSELMEDKKKARTKYTMKKPRSRRQEVTDGELSQRLAKIDPEFYDFLQKNSSPMLEMSDDGLSSDGMSDDLPTDEENVGILEPRPLNITSRKHKEEVDSLSSKDGSEMEEGGSAADVREGKMVTKAMIQAWVKSATGKNPSLASLSCLTTALHDAINGLLVDREDYTHTYFTDDATVFNCLVVACLKSVKDSVSLHLVTRPHAPPNKPPLPSTLKGWSKVKSIVRVYLSDLICLLETLKDPSMQCAILKHIQSFTTFCLCFPKITKRLSKVLIVCWSEGESHVQVLAFMVLHRITMLQPHPALHQLLKKLYLAFMSNSKFTSARTLPQIRFMQNCLVELLFIDPPTSYQHAFVYIRQLAVYLRSALTSGKKHSVKAVYNWQFIHCLDLWSHMLCHVTHDSLHPLIYPLVQVMLGAIHLQPSARHYPLRLHITRSLLELCSATGTFIPIAPYLLEILERHGVGVANHVTSGKPPNLAILLHATKQQLQSSTFQNALLNETFELMLKYFAIHSPSIGFPELAYPSLVRLRKVCKAAPFSWLRLQLKQLIEKVEVVGSEVTKLRAAVEFSPKDSDKVMAWERERREKGNAVTCLLATWQKVHKPSPNEQAHSESKASSCEESSISGQEDTADSSQSGTDTDGEDIIEEFELSSEDSDFN